ncbi:uncharacterized protein YhaN [Rhizobium pisi]|uniref:Uncharacterized protein YhaN n=1 Tax=Rhizobium pisi TaxID=574561 RepID=A0A427M933_9HYPH|nr:AAA family ATPase [Rhizobium pisi]MBB3138642.1 uncharacterized protein YhaN [Rhizobium pisi]RSB62082.1 hypothetical protein EFD55_30075 [Rhizobium pisi]TCA43036.1 hypothetical protein E0J16_32670 [Rhizobium pisi]
MRINRLDLTRYGKFTDGVINFGPRPADGPDLHIIYGPNEAGKSTTFDAILDLIFGIPSSSKYGFLHPYPTMRIGANMHVGGLDHEFVRIKRPQNSLLDDEERTLPDALVRADLGGIDRDAFTTMFSLDDETLEKGGEGILASKGDLGQLLFSASAGLSGLGRQLVAIRGEADSFYRYRARSGVLGDLKAKLQELKQQREALDLQASDHHKLVEERDRMGRLYEEAVGDRAATHKRINEIRRILQVLLPMNRLAGLKESLRLMEVVPEPPESWREELSTLRTKEIEHRVKLQAVLRSIGSIEEEATEIKPDPVALRLASSMDELAELKARFLTAEKDIPKLSARAADLSVESILLQLGRSGEASPTRLVLDAATVGTLRELIGSRSGVDAQRAAAAHEVAKAERALSAGCDEALEANSPLSSQRVRAFELLAATVKAVPRSDEEIPLRSLARRRDAASLTLSGALARLLPWRGTVVDLSLMAGPSPIRLEDWKNAFRQSEEKVRTSRADLDRIEPEVRRLESEIAAVREQAGEIDEASISASRGLRESAWTTHRQTMDAASADAFEAAMRADDHLGSKRLLHAAEISKLNQLLLRRASTASDVQSAEEHHRRALGELDRIRSEVADVVRELAPGARLDRSHPAELEDWLSKRDEALKAKEGLASIEQEIADVRDRVDRSRLVLMNAMTTAGLSFHRDADIAALLSVADEALDAHGAALGRVQEMERLRKERLERQRALDDAERDVAAWNSQWAAVCETCWLGELASVPGPSAANEILAALEKLASAIETKEGLTDRVQKMEKDRAAFEAMVLELCQKLGIAPDRSLSELAQAVVDKVTDAGLNKQRREKLDGELDGKRKEHHDLKLAQELLDAQAQQMIAFFGVVDLKDVNARMDLAARRRELVNSICELENEIVQSVGARDLSEVEVMAVSADRTELEAELAGLTPLLQDQDKRCSEIFHARSKSQDSLDAVGGDSKVAEIEERRRTTLLEIEDGAKRYMELRAGVVAADHGLKLYRDRHRSGMMSRASAAFRTISRGAYREVAAQPGKDGEILIAVSTSGGSKAAHELSKGARFQLYLALRVAGYHELVGNHAPIPFIADDIMETFDDFRAEEAFRLFSEMARHGQVIYLTHHRHLIDIARNVAPSARLHDLEALTSTGRIDVVAAE